MVIPLNKLIDKFFSKIDLNQDINYLVTNITDDSLNSDVLDYIYTKIIKTDISDDVFFETINPAMIFKYNGLDESRFNSIDELIKSHNVTDKKVLDMLNDIDSNLKGLDSL